MTGLALLGTWTAVAIALGRIQGSAGRQLWRAVGLGSTGSSPSLLSLRLLWTAISMPPILTGFQLVEYVPRGFPSYR